VPNNTIHYLRQGERSEHWMRLRDWSLCPSFHACVFVCVPVFKAPYLYNGARETHGHNGPPIGSRPLRVKWSRD